MLRFNQSQVDALQRDVFMRLLEQRIADQEDQSVLLPPETREELWSAAHALEEHGITSIRGCLVVVHIVWEMGTQVFDRIPAFGAVLHDPAASEADKVDALWLLRTQLLAALKGQA